MLKRFNFYGRLWREAALCARELNKWRREQANKLYIKVVRAHFLLSWLYDVIMIKTEIAKGDWWLFTTCSNLAVLVCNNVKCSIFCFASVAHVLSGHLISFMLMQVFFNGVFLLSHFSCWAMLFIHAPCFIHHSRDNRPASSFTPRDCRKQQSQPRLNSQGHNRHQSSLCLMPSVWSTHRTLCHC